SLPGMTNELPRERPLMRKFNFRLFLCLLGSIVLLAGLGFAVHWLQTGRIAGALLWQARRAEDQGKPEQTIRYLGRYLEFAPDAVEDRAHLARVLAAEVLSPQRRPSHKRVQQALFVLEDAVARAPDRQDVRRQLVRVALVIGRPDLGLEHVKGLP